MKGVTLGITDMKCEGCVSTISSALSGISGVHNAEVSLEEKKAVVQAEDSVAGEDLVSVVEEAGYKASVQEERAA
jgi:copper chaperone CopZ